MTWVRCADVDAAGRDVGGDEVLGLRRSLHPVHDLLALVLRQLAADQLHIESLAGQEGGDGGGVFAGVAEDRCALTGLLLIDEGEQGADLVEVRARSRRGRG